MQDLKNGDIILIKGFKDPANVNFYCHMHFKDLIGLPTRVSIAFNSFYVSHPNLDSVPLNECVEFDILESTDEISHQEFKSKQKLYQQMMGGQPKPIKNLDKLKNFFLKKNINESDVESLTPKQRKLINLIDKIESDELSIEEIENLIGDFGLLIKKLNDEGILSYIDPFSNMWGSQFQNAIFYHFYKSDPSFIWKLVDKYFSDVTKIGDTYYYDADYSDLGSLFNTGRSDISSDTISEILSGEYDMYNRYYDTDDIYRDVYDELTPEKKQFVNNRIRKELKQMKTIDTETDELEVISSEQGRDDVELTDDVITRILDDEDTMVYLINRELVDIGTDLGHVYEGCYSSILLNDWYKTLWGTLEGVVVDSKEGLEYTYKKNVWNKTGDRETKTMYSQRYPATNSIYYVVSNWLNYNKDKNGYNDNSLEYFGSYYNVIEDSIQYDLMDNLSVPRLDDYPDYREMEKCINYGISDYF